MPKPQCEDEDIRPALYRLRRICFMKMGLSSTNCWCIGAKEGGGNLECDIYACPPAAIDKLGNEE